MQRKIETRIVKPDFNFEQILQILDFYSDVCPWKIFLILESVA
jgi:hypothetical protein